MAEIPEISDLFLAAAEIEAETPITVGANMVGPDGRFCRPHRLEMREWDDQAGNFPLSVLERH